MRVTAQEAVTKRCQEGFSSGPMSHGGNTYVASAGQNGYGSAYAVATSPTHCIAGGCMAWRWTEERNNDGDLIGYCGKAGAA